MQKWVSSRPPAGAVAAGTLMLMISAVLASAAENTSRPASEPPVALTERQSAIRERITRLENTMIQLSRTLGETDPAKAERLQGALDESGRRQVKRRLDELVRHLSNADRSFSERLSDAAQDQTRLLDDLEAMLTVLTDTRNELDRRRAERERLERLRRTVATLRESQLDQVARNQQRAADQQLAQALQAQAETLEAIAQEQARLQQELRKDAARSTWGEQAARQNRLREEARQAAADLRRAAEQSSNPEADPALEQSSAEVSAATETMQAARDALEKRQPEEAEQAQAEAEQQLRRAIARLRDEAERLMSRDRVRELEAAQRATQEQAGELEQEMQSEGRPSAEQTPGQRQIADARQQMQRAADRLGENQPEEARPAQETAAAKLQEALDELEDALRQVRREELEELLASLESRFKTLLTQEESLRSDLAPLAGRTAAEWTRSEQLLLGERAQLQWRLAEEAAAIGRLLEDEGTTVMVPEIVRQLVLDMTGLARRLDAADAGPRTRHILDEVIETLREIIAAVEAQRKELQEGESSAAPPGAGGPAREALLPGSAELKLLKSAQQRINRRTVALAEAGGAEAAGDEFAGLAARQRELAEIARTINERK